jgi:hypothetical protein
MPEIERQTKTCPDCAEEVLEAARKCRFCGYRFDEERSAVDEDGLFGNIFRRRKRPATLPQVLHRWGVVLRDGETEGHLVLGRIDNEVGFVVVTSERFFFVESSHPGKGPKPISHQHELGDLLRVHVVRKRMKKSLAAEWRDTQTLVELGGRELTRLQDLLAPHALVDERS